MFSSFTRLFRPLLRGVVAAGSVAGGLSWVHSGSAGGGGAEANRDLHSSKSFPGVVCLFFHLMMSMLCSNLLRCSVSI